MTASREHLDTSKAIHGALAASSGKDFVEVTLGADGYSDWYALLLTSFTVLVGDDDIVFGSGQVLPEGGVRVVLFTETLAVYAVVKDPSATAAMAIPVAFPRSSIVSLEVGGSTKINARGSEGYGWPGDLHVVARYEGFPHPVVLYGDSFAGWADDNVAPIWKLVGALRADLQGSRRRT